MKCAGACAFGLATTSEWPPSEVCYYSYVRQIQATMSAFRPVRSALFACAAHFSVHHGLVGDKIPGGATTKRPTFRVKHKRRPCHLSFIQSVYKTMIKVIWFLKRAKHLSPLEFCKWWLESHAQDDVIADQTPNLKKRIAGDVCQWLPTVD